MIKQEATIRTGAAQYRRSSEAGVSGKATETAAFNLVNRDLEKGIAPADRRRALGKNHMLWSILVKDMSLSDNKLPDDLKSELIRLGLWSMSYSTLAVLEDVSIEPLLTVDRNVLAGLLGQASVEPIIATSGSIAFGPL